MRRIDVDRRFAGQNLTLDRTCERTKEFALACAEVVQEANSSNKIGSVGLVEVHDAMEEVARVLGEGDRDKGLETFLNDGLHLTGEGYKVFLLVCVNFDPSQRTTSADCDGANTESYRPAFSASFCGKDATPFSVRLLSFYYSSSHV